MDRPNPVPSPAGFVVKNGLNSFSLTSGGMPVPLSRILYFHAVTEVLGRCSQRRLVVASVRLGLTLRGGVEAVGDQVEQRPRNLLREQIDLTGSRVKGPLQGDCEALLLGSRSVIGEIEALIDQGVDIDRTVLSGPLTGVQQHVLDDGVGALAMLHDLVEIALQRIGDLADLCGAACCRGVRC